MLPFFASIGNSMEWERMMKNCEEWRFALADRPLDMPIHFARHRYRYRL